MKEIGIIFKFELKSKLKEKAIMITTIITLAVVLLATFIPTIIKAFDKGNNESVIVEESNTEEDNTIIPYGYLINDSTISEDVLKSSYIFLDAKKYTSLEDAKADIENKVLDKLIIINSLTDIKILAEDIGMYDSSPGEIEEQISLINRNINLDKLGISPDEVDEASNVLVNMEVETLGKVASSNYFVAYIGVFIIYFIIILYGSSVATSVAREKNDRTMELLITNTTSKNLIIGKVLSALVVSMAQVVSIILVASLGIFINKSNYPAFILNIIKTNISFDVISIYLIFLIFGALMYYFIFAAVGALVSKVEEVSSAMGSINFIFMAVFMVSMAGMNMPHSTLMKVASLVPFSSPMSMFVRYSMISVPIIDVIISFILLLALTVVSSYLSIKIYRMGTLNYGNKINLSKAIKMVLKEK